MNMLLMIAVVVETKRTMIAFVVMRMRSVIALVAMDMRLVISLTATNRDRIRRRSLLSINTTAPYMIDLTVTYFHCMCSRSRPLLSLTKHRDQ